MKNRPVVGISGSILIEKADGFVGYRRSYVNEDYVESVILNGGTPFILPLTTNETIIESYLDSIDALILSGGHDVYPINYNQEPLEKLGEVYPDRDYFDFKLLELAIKKQIPILGVCRGFQLMNVYHGGSLYQDLSYRDKDTIKHDQKYTSHITTHSLVIEKNTKLFDIYENENLLVNSFHHQIINEVGENLIASAYAKDGVVEAIEHKDYDFMIGVQWHPEMLHKSEIIMNNIFKELINKAHR